MKLRKVQIKEFKSIWDSGSFDVEKITCLVGKNESGKTSILQALYRLNPIDGSGVFDITDDYPRAEVVNYQHDVESKHRDHAVVVTATFELEPEELGEISKAFGLGILERTEVTVSTGYAKNATGGNQLFVEVPLVENVLLKNLVDLFNLPENIREQAKQQKNLKELSKFLEEISQKQSQAVTEAQTNANKIPNSGEKTEALEKIKGLAESDQAKALRGNLAEILKRQDAGLYIWEAFLRQHYPKFLYFNEYYQMRGCANVEMLKQRKANNKLEASDHPLLGLIELARLDLEKLLSPTRTQELKNNLQGASNYLSTQILKFWSQNKHLRMNFDVRHALPGDPEGMKQGNNIWGEVFDSKHQVSTGIGSRSAGFVWFFSFLAWYSSLRRKEMPLVLLFDEPGLSLHGRAQEDLLRYFEAEIATNPKHQLLYTTHSPFMVDPQHFERVRIVQDKGIDTDEQLPREENGTKVFTDVLEAGADSLFPLQGALGFGIYQTLFIGPNNLVVEGVSDLLYIQTISGYLQTIGREGLDPRWTITPVGGSDKIPTFLALLGSQKLNLAALIDYQKGDQQMIENIYKKRLLKKSHVLTFAEFTGKTEADIEDMFDESFYIQLVNGEFANALNLTLDELKLMSRAPRVLVRLEEYFAANPLKGGTKFNHYRPARHFSEKVAIYTIPEATLDRFETAFKAVNALIMN